MSKFTVTPYFAVPIASTLLDDALPLNGELRALFLAKEQEGDRWKNPNRNSYRQDAVYESRFDLFDWPDTSLQKLRTLCLEALFNYVVRISSLDPKRIPHLRLKADSWFHVTRKGGYFTAHNHPNASWACVYCVDPGDSVPDKPESGLLRFFDPRALGSMYLDPGNSHIKEPFAWGNVMLPQTAGQLTIFPAYLLHEVAPYFGERERITVAMNCWFHDVNLSYPGEMRV